MSVERLDGVHEQVGHRLVEQVAVSFDGGGGRQIGFERNAGASHLRVQEVGDLVDEAAAAMRRDGLID